MLMMLSQVIKFAVEGIPVADSMYSSSFYIDDDDDPSEEEEVVFCKNNICVHLTPSVESEDLHIPGYLSIKSKTRKSGYVRLVLSWTPNSHFSPRSSPTRRAVVPSGPDPLREDFINEVPPRVNEVFNVDLSEMKTLKLFFDEEDVNSGQFVIGNHENHYKVFHFHYGGLNRITQVLQDWHWCSKEYIVQEDVRKVCYTVINKKIIAQQADVHPEEGRFDPMSVNTWRTYANEIGQIEDVANFRKAVFFGGLSPEVRKDAWKYLLFHHPFDSTNEERLIDAQKKEQEYMQINQSRLSMTKEEHDKFWRDVQCTVDKDVVRTDRTHPYFAGENNPHVQQMRNILLNYAVFNPTIGYNQGMSDLLASVLSIVQDEVDAFWCFVGLMEHSVFVTTPKDDAMDTQLMYLRELLRMMEPEFYAHVLLQDDAMDMLFCHRWLLLCFKREFFNEEVLKMWEACWSRYQTDYFHIFLCVAMVGEYGGEVVAQDMPADEMLQYFTNLSMNMDGQRVLRKARQLLLKFRQLPGIPCMVRGLLSGTGVWDSAPLPEIECNCHGNCSYERSSWQSSVCKESGENTANEKEKYEEESSEKRVNSEKSHSLKEGPETDGANDDVEETSKNEHVEKGSDEPLEKSPEKPLEKGPEEGANDDEETNDNERVQKDSEKPLQEGPEVPLQKGPVQRVMHSNEDHKVHSNTDHLKNGETEGTNGLTSNTGNGESHVNRIVQSEEQQGKAMSEERESCGKQAEISLAS